MMRRGNVAAKMDRIQLTLLEELKGMVPTWSIFSHDTRKTLKWYVEDRQDSETDTQMLKNKKVSINMKHSFTFFKVALVHVLDTFVNSDEPVAPDTAIHLFLILSSMGRCQDQFLDPTVYMTQTDMENRILGIVTDAFSLMAVRKERLEPTLSKTMKAYKSLRSRQGDVFDRLLDVMGKSVLSHIASWAELSLEPHPETESRLAACHVTHTLYPVDSLVVATVTMYSKTPLQFAIHSTLAPFLTVFQFYLNLGPMLGNNFGHLKTDPVEWLGDLSEIYTLCESAVPAFFAATIRLDIGSSLESDILL